MQESDTVSSKYLGCVRAAQSIKERKKNVHERGGGGGRVKGEKSFVSNSALPSNSKSNSGALNATAETFSSLILVSVLLLQAQQLPLIPTKQGRDEREAAA